MFNFTKDNMGKGSSMEGGSRNHLAQGTNITGDIETNGDIRIDGILKGSLISKGKLVVGESGKIEGEVTCVNAHISGTISGNLRVKELLQLMGSAKIDGQTDCAKIAVEQGAVINGKLNMGAIIKEMPTSVGEKERSKEKTA
jgi:cytoskeletal protein CcmA (bactofilin family)